MYQYKGKQAGAADPWNPASQVKEPKPIFEPMPCGTNAAYNRHMRHGEEACQYCKDAHADYMREMRPRTRELKPCGTVAAYRRHYQRGEKACPECAAAQAAYKAAWKAREAA